MLYIVMSVRKIYCYYCCHRPHRYYCRRRYCCRRRRRRSRCRRHYRRSMRRRRTTEYLIWYVRVVFAVGDCDNCRIALLCAAHISSVVLVTSRRVVVGNRNNRMKVRILHIYLISKEKQTEREREREREGLRDGVNFFGKREACSKRDHESKSRSFLR